MNSQAVFTAMLPEHLLLLGLVLLVLLEILGRWPRAALNVALGCVALAALSAAVLSYQGFSGAPFPGHFSVDPAGLAVKAMVLALTLPVLLMSREDFASGEFATLVISSLYGVCLVQSSDSFLTLFLGLEILSIPVYTLVLLAYQRPACAEAALKYLVLGGTATASFLMGVSLLYGASGNMDVATFTRALGASDNMNRAAVVLVLLAFFLKAAIVPFHTWAPDAYEAASVPVTAFMSVVVKAAVLLAVVRIFGQAQLASPLLEIVAVLPLLSMAWGNLAAMRQPGLRRMLAYSSIAHAGYLFFALLGDPAGRLQTVAFYLLAYGLLNLLAFAALPPAEDDQSRDRLENLKGLFHRAPFAALMLAMAMLSLAGIPPLPGFVAKFMIFKNVMSAGYTVYAVLGLVASYLGIYFYLRVIQFMFMSPNPSAATGEGTDTAAVPVMAKSRAYALTATLVCLFAALWISVFPSSMMARF